MAARGILLLVGIGRSACPLQAAAQHATPEIVEAAAAALHYTALDDFDPGDDSTTTLFDSRPGEALTCLSRRDRASLTDHLVRLRDLPTVMRKVVVR
jgi:hypothetical protein